MPIPGANAADGESCSSPRSPSQHSGMVRTLFPVSWQPCEYKYVGGAWFTGVAATRKQQAKAIVTSLYDDIRPGPDMQQRAAGEEEVVVHVL